MHVENELLVMPCRIIGVSDSRDGQYRYYSFGSFSGGWSERLPIDKANGFKRGDSVDLVYDMVGAAEQVSYRRDGESRSMATQNLTPELIEMRYSKKAAS